MRQVDGPTAIELGLEGLPLDPRPPSLFQIMVWLSNRDLCDLYSLVPGPASLLSRESDQNMCYHVVNVSVMTTAYDCLSLGLGGPECGSSPITYVISREAVGLTPESSLSPIARRPKSDIPSTR